VRRRCSWGDGGGGDEGNNAAPPVEGTAMALLSADGMRGAEVAVVGAPVLLTRVVVALAL
jgi:hypothetical protein